MMRLLPFAVLATGLISSVFVLYPVRSAPVCSAGPDYNPLAESDVVVAGTVLGWERVDSAAAPSSGGSGFIPIRLTLRVEQRFKGTTPAEIVVVDQASLVTTAGQSGWAGGAGACGSFDADPTGMYAVLGLTNNGDGTYQPNRPRTFYIGSRPPAPRYEQGIARIASYDPTAAIAAGGATVLGCPAGTDACAFGAHVQRWLSLGEFDAIVSLLNVREVECPGPTPIGLGGPYPLCDGSTAGERRFGADIVRLGSEGGVGGIDFFRDALARRGRASRLVSIGCAEGEAGAGAPCGERFSLVFADPNCPMQRGCAARPVTVFLVSRAPSGQFRLMMIIFGAEVLVPSELLTGGRVVDGFATGPDTFVTYFPWSPAMISALPPAGVGPADDATIEPLVLPLVLVLAFGGVGALAWRRQRRTRRDF